ncbi:MAG: TldD/PmbA family protein [Turicibacter sp.]|nr:TldD/PmbA family protein [Turicibacter sp.]
MLNQLLIQDVLDEGIAQGADFAEIFVEQSESRTLSMISSKIDNANRGLDFGIGIRLINGLQSVYGYTNDPGRDSLLKTVRTLAAALTSKSTSFEGAMDLRRKNITNSHLIKQDLNDVAPSRRLEVLRKLSEGVKNYHESISQSSINLLEKKQNILVANSEGVLAEDSRNYTRLYVTAVASKGNEMQTGSHGPGAHAGFEYVEGLDLDFYANDAARMAVTMLNAGYAPSGQMPVVIDNGFGGVIFHEACGHGLEATAVAKNLSVFAGRVGEKVASDGVTLIDDGTIPNGWGSLNIDDEGNATKKNTLIENGILKGYLIDKLGGRRMGQESTGSGRRQNYRFAPTSRMTNTFIANGPHTREEIIADTEYGIYARYMGGGSVNTATGDFNFATNEAYIIRNGKIAEPVRGATLIGNGPDIIQKIDKVANNLSRGQGMCGSVSGSIPADVGQPALRVTDITVGGNN